MKEQYNKSRLRQIIVIALLFMMIGTSSELYLLGHYEDWKQLMPVILIGTALVWVGVLFFKPSNLNLKVFQALLTLIALSGIYGTFLHLTANYEFEAEMKPTAEIGDLLWESLSGALPTLAPASLIVLALIGYSYILILKQQK